MSADLEVRQQNMLEMRLPPLIIKNSQSSEITEDQEAHVPKSESEEECKTPKSPKHMIPKILNCPPAPRKPRFKRPSCKRKLSEFQFFEVVPREEIESFFQEYEVNSKRRSISQVD